MTDLRSNVLLAEHAALANVPQQQTGEAVGPERPLRYSREIQGNILAAFNKDHQTCRLVWFKDKDSARRWLLSMLGHISVTADVEQFNEQFSLRRRVEETDPKDMKAVWVSMSLTYQGFEMLAEQWTDMVNKDGAKLEKLGFTAAAMNAFDRASALHDNGPSAPSEWEFGGKLEEMPHAVVIVAADDKNHLANREELLDLVDEKNEVTRHPRNAPESHDCRLRGQTLPPPLKGHEHFGFKDGVSQPGVKGFHREDAKRKGEREGHPGTLLIEPGEFVLGQPKEPVIQPHSTDEEIENAGKAAAAASTVPSWMNNGSFQVLRKLKQDVPKFNALMKKVADETGADEYDAAARLVGRHRDGSPLARPIQEHKGLGSDLNDFDYNADAMGDRTPCYAHIRKTSPRAWHDNEQTTGAPAECRANKDGDGFEQVKRHRIVRRGITYGPVFEGPQDDGRDRGLLFVAYCASLRDQFEFQQTKWANNPVFTPGSREAMTGTDPLIGAKEDGKTGELTVRTKASQETLKKVEFERPIITRGAVYSFAPSMSTLWKLAAGEPL